MCLRSRRTTKHLTLRQRLEQHRNQPALLQCHSKIDPWGVALEEFDAGGRLKQQPVDARSTLPDKTEVSGVNDLKRYLAEDRIDQVAFSVLKHLATYATGRSLTYNELEYLKQDGLKLKAGGYRMKDMIRYVVEQQDCSWKSSRIQKHHWRHRMSRSTSDSTAAPSSKAWAELRWPCRFSTRWAPK